MKKLKNIVGDSFSEYSAAVLQARALVDVRDGLKPSARQIFYAMLLEGFTPDKAFNKTATAVGATFKFYIHGDASALGIIMRAAQPFSMRYPLIDVEGSYGSLLESGNWASARYTGSRLSPLGAYLFSHIKDDTIKDWREAYTGKDYYPSVLPSMGYYNICNPTMGIGIGMASSIPGFNVKEVNEAMIKLLWNPAIDFDEIYCRPDFPTGGVLLNEEEVKDSLKDGFGKSCRLRSVVEYDSTERALVVKEVPYGVYTNTICKQLEVIEESEDNPGVERHNDLTGSEPLIKIYLKRGANPEKVLRHLMKKTSLQSFYGINMTMLKDGRFPRVFGWKEALQEHLDHEKHMYINFYEHIKKVSEERLHIVEGLIKAISMIEEVVQTIKSSASTAQAKENLVKLGFTSAQSEAILKITLGRLVNLEINKLEKEKNTLNDTIFNAVSILTDESLLKKEIEKGLLFVANKFGDARRTKVMNIATEEEEEPQEVVELVMNLTSYGAVIPQRISTLYTQRKGNVGTKVNLEQGEYIIDSVSVKSNESILLFDTNGMYYTYRVSELIDAPRTPIKNGLCAVASSGDKSNQFIIFVTEKGIVKKSRLAEYTTARKDGVSAIALTTGDKVVRVLVTNKDRLGVLSASGNLIIFETEPINATGRTTKGVKAIDLASGDRVVSAQLVSNDTKEILSISREAIGKRTSMAEFTTIGRGGKGSKIQTLKTGDEMSTFLPVRDEKEILLITNTSQAKINLLDIPISARARTGSKILKIKEKENLINVLKI